RAHWILVCCLLSGCFSADRDSAPPIWAYGPSPKKQKQRIAVLQKKLALAERELKRSEEYVELVQKEINDTHLSLIRRELDRIEEQLRACRFDGKTPPAEIAAAQFGKERETLCEIIENGNSAAAFQAQVELDRILRLITELAVK